MSFTDSTARLAANVEDELVALHDKVALGVYSEKAFAVLAAGVIAVARAQAVALADVGLATELTKLWQRYVTPIGLGLDPNESLDAAEAALAETTDSPAWQVNAAAALGVLARSQVYNAAQTAYQEGMRIHGVELWTREADADACPVCLGLADGTELSTRTPMYRHKGCGCTQRPTR